MIFFQDNKERQVHWFLFPISAILFSILHYSVVGVYSFIINSSLNLILILGILSCLSIYSRLVLKTKFFDAFGLGDFLFFLAIAFSFSTITFIISFIMAIAFCLLINILFKKTNKFGTVPLAGNMSLFFIGILFLDWFNIYKNTYLF